MLSVAIYTLNEEVNLPHCLASLANCDDIVVVDSFSSDNTCEIARKAGARVFQHEFTGFGDQRNWSFDNITFKHPWLLILDADERVTSELWNEMISKIKAASPGTVAFRLKRKFYWEGSWLKHANLYPSWIVRLVRPSHVRYINRGHAETQKIDGEIGSLEEDLIDENHKGLTAWRERQMEYAQKEAEYEVSQRQSVSVRDLLSSDPLIRRSALKSLSREIPCRSTSFFIYSYFLRNGWKDGLIGFKFCLEKSRYQGTVGKIAAELRKAK